ncbi:hypothetical protein RchiOBHm_Chr2g0125211 [Rosa chinensis]|uniref:Uncharacterized protein n=1 Tax=Rosa chinensis TaxID=74649 RepID=A0A2P6RTH7_ROSCH|nr:hypothetical protein RchiOBHm_Chr2g0125211 [Rosa chinensis]
MLLHLHALLSFHHFSFFSIFYKSLSYSTFIIFFHSSFHSSFLPYINTFSFHSKTHSFIHFISLSHHFLSIFLSHQFLHPSHLLCLSISSPYFFFIL